MKKFFKENSMIIVISIVIGFIIGMSGYLFHLNQVSRISSGWMAAMVNFIGLLIATNGQRAEKQRDEENRKETAEFNLEVERKKDFSARPRPGFRYLNRLLLNDRVYYNLTPRTWVDFTSQKGDRYMASLKYPGTFKKRPKIGFTIDDRFEKSLLGITNLSEHDMLYCKITMVYSCGPNTTKIMQGKANKNLTLMNQEIRQELIEVPLISAKEQAAIATYAYTNGVPFHMVTIIIDFITERDEALHAVFSSSKDELIIHNYFNKADCKI